MHQYIRDECNREQLHNECDRVNVDFSLTHYIYYKWLSGYLQNFVSFRCQLSSNIVSFVINVYMYLRFRI